jgi:hypothetical protein
MQIWCNFGDIDDSQITRANMCVEMLDMLI